jgi:hypothetical protein
MKEGSLRQVVKRLFLASLVRSSRMGKSAPGDKQHQKGENSNRGLEEGDY